MNGGVEGGGVRWGQSGGEGGEEKDRGGGGGEEKRKKEGELHNSRSKISHVNYHLREYCVFNVLDRFQ